ncbi:MAG TPA: hypothetical protein VKU36_00020 [Candidatus Babeliales bacterium]|jgi:hypothetical protein|nr:hypothetical protein [Candidatus Babeliales bacterium]
MKKIYILVILMITGLWTVSFPEQENEQLVVPKNSKRKYVSEQQYTELDGEMVVTTNQAAAVLANTHLSLSMLQQTVMTIQKKSLCNVYDYIDGAKDCFLKQADKVQRTNCYEKVHACKQTIESSTKKLKRIQDQIEVITNELQQQLQEIMNIIAEDIS